MFSKKYIFILLLNIFLVVFINIIAYLFNYQINLNIFIYMLAFFVIIWFMLIIIELWFYIFNEIKKKNNYLLFFLYLLLLFFIFKLYFFWDYFYFRYENYQNFNSYFLVSFNSALLNLLSDFRNFNWIVLVNLFKDLLAKEWITQYYLYSFFQFISAIYLYRIFNLFSKDRILTILLIFLYFGIEMFFIISQAITYINILLPAFIIFIFYLFNLEKNKNFLWYLFYIFSYLFLITSRPDFFFLALVIEVLNAYLKNKKIISLWQNIFFYIFLIPYYFIINNYLLTHISSDQALLWKTYDTNNFWHIAYDKIFWEEIINKFVQNIQIISYDYMFLFFLLIVIVWNIFLFIVKKQKFIFNILFLFLYSIFLFFIVIFIHDEGFINSFFKYLSIIYLIIFILFWLLILKVSEVYKDKNVNIFLNIFLLISIIFNYSITLGNYNKLSYYIESWNLYLSEAWYYSLWEETKWVYEFIYDRLIVENILYHKLYLDDKFNKECKSIVIWNFAHNYNYMSIEYNIWMIWNKYDIESLINLECLNIFVINEFKVENKSYITNNPDNYFDKLNNYFNITGFYDRHITNDLWLNLYILKSKDAK